MLLALRKIYRALNKMSKRKEPKIKNGFGNMWLGELVNELGGDWEKIRCRGEVVWYEMNIDDTLSVSMMCAWCEQSELRKRLEKEFGLTIFFIDEEPGCGVYQTNDKLGCYFPDRYLLDSYDEPQYFTNIDDAAKCVANLISKDVEPDVDKINNALDNYMSEQDDDDIWYALHEFAIVD